MTKKSDTSEYEYIIDSVGEFIKFIEDRYFSFRHGSWIFRGHSSWKYELKPTIGRLQHSEKSFEKMEKSIFDLFKRSAYQYTTREPSNDFEWLALAQHHGLPTRLLDWTTNPLTALFFSVRSKEKENGVIFAINSEKRIADTILEQNQPFKIDKTYKYLPKIIANRLHSQDGVFTIHCDPQNTLEDSRDDWDIEKIKVPSELKEELQYLLFRQGIHHAKLFPDLDGLSKHLAWQHTQKPVIPREV